MRTVVLIAGPPCAGKSTLAQALANPGDLVLDRDAIAQRLGSPVRWGHDEVIAQRAEQVMLDEIARIARAEAITAYVVRSVPAPAQRLALAHQLRATAVHVLNPGAAECMRRAHADARPEGTAAAIRSWYARYRPCAVDADPGPAAATTPVRTSRTW
ncbi:AAA family ATPase [Amycolatopsis methanolica]|uniref:Putative phage prohead protease n=1 Tax=Amycolatopsis methanolica 239 TaxID=1068978 RepID=A0A076N4Y9_AMYME|nr:AAA family ATPase [Amycolatopsis methanolica]AIJ26371.1 putative phage prohead protease [Amycolatopsis methanolica 239]AIJ26430.1 putative phage prohead protease [Amycolatopsis methanolica 239]